MESLISSHIKMPRICVGRRVQLVVCYFRENHLIASFKNYSGKKGKRIHEIR